MKQLIKKFVESYGPSGYEHKIRDVISAEIQALGYELSQDALGNLIAFKKGDGTGKKVMIAGHMDEIGLIVTHIDDNGFLRVSNVGGVNPAVALGQRVLFENGTVGVVGSEPIEEPKDLKIPKLFVDIGARDRQEAEKKVQVGDMAGFLNEMLDFGERLVAKSMDDRIGCAVMVLAMRRLDSTPNDCYFVFTTQEEVGLRGARTSSYGISPDIGISLDVTKTGDTPKALTMAVSLGKGTAIKVCDKSIICHPKVKGLMVEAAKKHNIPYQMEVLDVGGTDSGAIHLTKEGVPSGVISIPTRYVHTPSEMVDIGDIEASVELLVRVLESRIDI